MSNTNYRTDAIYHWRSPDGDDEMFFISDGEGRIFYDTIQEAKDNIGEWVTVITVDILED